MALPAYQSYIARSQVTEAVGLLAGVKTYAEEQYGNGNGFPDDADLAGTSARLGGRYTSRINSDGTDLLTATMKVAGSAVAGAIANLTITMQYNTITGIWTCNPALNKGTILNKHLPTTCR